MPTRTHIPLVAAMLLAMVRLAHAEPVLHERVFLTGLRCRGGICTTTGANGEEVRAIEQNGQLLPAPTEGPAPSDKEQVFHSESAPSPGPPQPGGPPLPGDPPPERRPQVRMDRETGPEAAVTHSYHEIFTPSIFPYKRTSVLDMANEDESLSVFAPQRQPIVALGADMRRPDFDAFWGSAVLDLEPGLWIALPSVAADARLLEYHTDPPTRPGALEFARDGADNFFVRATTNGGAGGRRRLVWLTDAPAIYFGGPLPAGTLDEIPRTLLRPLPPRLKKTARGVLDALGIHPGPRSSIRSVLDPLITHFRAFQTGALPSPSESTYRDLALSSRGVCRHRSYAFVITALGAGLPARYVENELHVFVEVYLPHLGWRRINLGGATLDDQVASGEERPAHRPADDDLPRPPEFTQNATPPSRHGGEGGGPGRGKRSGGAERGEHVDLGALLENDAQLAARPGPRVGTRLTLSVDARVAYRGDTIDVAGAVIDTQGAPAANLPVEIYLSAANAERIAETRTGPDGRFAAQALVPASLRLGKYVVVARTPGDKRRLPSSSRAP